MGGGGSTWVRETGTKVEHRKKTKENAKYYEYDYAIRDISTTEADVATDIIKS